MQFLRIFLLACLILSPAWAQEELISQVKDGTVAVDGNLVEWPNGEWLPVSVGFDGLPVLSLRESPITAAEIENSPALSEL